MSHLQQPLIFNNRALFRNKEQRLFSLSGQIAEEEYHGKLNNYGDDSVEFVKDCT
ncbi:hypothetical protein V7127_19820 [Bacillus sp. JJ1773]|uniref:hypothetical protein n=1 Tax=Bacillus sp. JJ1773 TaxID=3122965 RepID=UPI002FFE7D6E